MKIVVLTVVILFVLVSCGTQEEGRRPTSAHLTSGKQILGGYTPIALDAELVQKAMDFVISQKRDDYPHVKAFHVQEAFSQVVAGTNIKLIIAYELIDDPAKYHALVVVNFDLQGHPQDIRELNTDYKIRQ